MMPRPFLIALVGLLAPLAAHAASGAPKQYIKVEVPPGYEAQLRKVPSRTYRLAGSKDVVVTEPRTYVVATNRQGVVRVWGKRYATVNWSGVDYRPTASEFPIGKLDIGSVGMATYRSIYDGKTGRLVEPKLRVEPKSGELLDRHPMKDQPSHERILYRDASGQHHLLVQTLKDGFEVEHREISHAEFMRLKYPNFR